MGEERLVNEKEKKKKDDGDDDNNSAIMSVQSDYSNYSQEKQDNNDEVGSLYSESQEGGEGSISVKGSPMDEDDVMSENNDNDDDDIIEQQRPSDDDVSMQEDDDVPLQTTLNGEKSMGEEIVEGERSTSSSSINNGNDKKPSVTAAAIVQDDESSSQSSPKGEASIGEEKVSSEEEKSIHSEEEEKKAEVFEQERLLAAKKEEEEAAAAAKAEAERLDKERIEQEELAAAAARRREEEEQARLELERQERERIAAIEAAAKEEEEALQKRAKEEQERREREKLAAEEEEAARQAEIERKVAERVEQELTKRLEQERIERERIEAEKLAEQRAAEAKRLDQERLERERIDAEMLTERLKAEKQERLEKEAARMESAKKPSPVPPRGNKPKHDVDITEHDAMGYLTRQQSDEVNRMQIEKEEKFENDLRDSFKRAQSSPLHSASKPRASDRHLNGYDEPADAKSDGGGHRHHQRRASKGSSSKSSSKKGKRRDSSDSLLSPLEKLKLAQAKLENDVGDDDEGGKSEKKDLMNLLSSSIRDLQAQMPEEEGNRRRFSRSESYEYSSPGFSSKKSRSPSRRLGSRSTSGHSRDNRSLGRRSRSSKSRESGSRDSKGRKKFSNSSSSRRLSLSERSQEEGAVESTLMSSSKSGSRAPVPKGVKKALACVRGGVALPREVVVSSVVRKLVSKIDRAEQLNANAEGDDKNENGPSYCVAILSSPASDDNPQGQRGGEGKTTVAALACVRGDVRTRYHQGIAWLNRENRPLDLCFESYSKALSDICRQIGVKPQQLRLSPVVRTPGEDEKVAKLRMESNMREAQVRMGKLLTSLQRSSKRSSRRESSSQPPTSVLVVLDDVADASDIEWFQFRRGGKNTSDQINDLLITSRQTEMRKVTPLTVPPLETREGIRLLVSECDLPSNHPLSNNRTARGLVKDCLLHPLTIKFAGRWLSLKRATSGGKKGIDEILGEVSDAIREARDNHSDSADRLYALLTRAMSPLIKGKGKEYQSP